MDQIIENTAQVAVAIDWYEKGLDFADALHLTAANEGATLYSLRRALVKRARSCGADASVIP